MDYITSVVTLDHQTAGDFQITLVRTINISCAIAFSSDNGYLQLGRDCFSRSSDIEVTNAEFDFQGIVDHPLLDAKLKF